MSAISSQTTVMFCFLLFFTLQNECNKNVWPLSCFETVDFNRSGEIDMKPAVEFNSWKPLESLSSNIGNPVPGTKYE